MEDSPQPAGAPADPPEQRQLQAAVRLRRQPSGMAKLGTAASMRRRKMILAAVIAFSLQLKLMYVKLRSRLLEPVNDDDSDSDEEENSREPSSDSEGSGLMVDSRPAKRPRHVEVEDAISDPYTDSNRVQLEAAVSGVSREEHCIEKAGETMANDQLTGDDEESGNMRL